MRTGKAFVFAQSFNVLRSLKYVLKIDNLLKYNFIHSKNYWHYLFDNPFKNFLTCYKNLLTLTRWDN